MSLISLLGDGAMHPKASGVEIEKKRETERERERRREIERGKKRMSAYLEPLTLFSSCFASLNLKFKENIWRGSSQMGRSQQLDKG